MSLPNHKPSRNWKIVWWCQPYEVTRGPWRGRWLSRRTVKGYLTAREAWRYWQWAIAGRGVARVEMWHGRRRHLARNKPELVI